jgi:glyoxylase-like metal-dependent hydrolase (beta-lactamase superfamily II)
LDGKPFGREGDRMRSKGGNVTAIRKPGKINENTTLLDIGMFGIYGVTGVYLVQGTRKCLIDAGTHTQAAQLVKMLTELSAFPPDLVILTHPHWDHAQGIPGLRMAAAQQGKQIEVLAAEDAIPLLAEPSFNDVFGHGPYESIRDVTPVAEGDSIDLGGLSLSIYDVPGHCRGNIAILDEKNRNLFVGDSIGDKVGDRLFLPPFMPPFWDPDAFLVSIEKLKGLDFQSVSIAHFGCIYGSEATTILDEAVQNDDLWWQFYQRHADKLGDNGYLLRAMREEIDPEIPEVRAATFFMSIMLKLATGVGSLLGNKTAIIDRLALGDTLKWLAIGYSLSTRIV